MQVQNLLNAASLAAISAAKAASFSAMDPMAAWFAGGMEAAKQTKDIVLGKTKKTKVNKAKTPKAKKAKAPKATTKAPKASHKGIMVNLKKEVKKAIMALSASKAHVVEATCARSLSAERRWGYEGLIALKEIQKDLWGGKLSKDSVQKVREALASLSALYRALNFAGIKLA